MLTQNATIIWM